jgi:uncharacterized protein (DUF58 family)
MTTTSITLMLAGITTLNIVWGFPWINLFSSCCAIVGVGLICNRWFRPSLRVDVRVPVSVPATQKFDARIHVSNLRRTPAIDLFVGFDVQRSDTWNTRHIFSRERVIRRVIVGNPVSISVVGPRGHDSVPATMMYQDRGIHELPPVLIESTFPFHIIRSLRRVRTGTQIAITPRPLGTSESNFAVLMTRTVDEISSRLLVGDSLQYTGSREYQDGMPVRRWDFGSWARLGKPIVREYQASTLQSVWLVVDTAGRPDVKNRVAQNDLEHVLSCAADVIPKWLQRMVRLHLHVTSEPSMVVKVDALDDVRTSLRSTASVDAEQLLIRLAMAEKSDVATANARLIEVLSISKGKPMLVITSRQELPPALVESAHCRIVCIDHASVVKEGILA